MLHQTLRSLSLHGPVLVEVTPAPEHIQHPVEASEEHWVGVEGGLFEASELEEETYLIYTRASGAARARQPAAVKKTIRKTTARAPRWAAHAALLPLPPVTRSQARPRARGPPIRLTF